MNIFLDIGALESTDFKDSFFQITLAPLSFLTLYFKRFFLDYSDYNANNNFVFTHLCNGEQRLNINFYKLWYEGRKYNIAYHKYTMCFWNGWVFNLPFEQWRRGVPTLTSNLRKNMFMIKNYQNNRDKLLMRINNVDDISFVKHQIYWKKLGIHYIVRLKVHRS